jgi:hypothetical protein
MPELNSSFLVDLGITCLDQDSLEPMSSDQEAQLRRLFSLCTGSDLDRREQTRGCLTGPVNEDF